MNDKTSLQRARDLKERFASNLRRYPNVSGVGVGYKVVKGRRTDRICIRVYVTRKLPQASLRPDEVLPEQLEGVPTDVIEAKFTIRMANGVPPVAEHRSRHNPLIGGISVGNLTLGGSGTLGVSVYDNISHEDMILSNWHVLCGRQNCAVGESVIQPGTGGGDIGGPSDIVARLQRSVLSERVDAAIARLTGHRFLLKELFGVGPVSQVGMPELGLRVRKSGRTTGVTVGTIVDVGADVDVGGYPGGDRTFRDQITIEDGADVSRPGDSGSVWVDDSERAVALNFAGSNGLGIANPMSVVLAELNVSLHVGVTTQDFIATTHSLML